jgi:hypothetical protein
VVVVLDVDLDVDGFKTPFLNADHVHDHVHDHDQVSDGAGSVCMHRDKTNPFLNQCFTSALRRPGHPPERSPGDMPSLPIIK